MLWKLSSIWLLLLLQNLLNKIVFGNVRWQYISPNSNVPSSFLIKYTVHVMSFNKFQVEDTRISALPQYSQHAQYFSETVSVTLTHYVSLRSKGTH